MAKILVAVLDINRSCLAALSLYICWAYAIAKLNRR
jgi:hypothetical protein